MRLNNTTRTGFFLLSVAMPAMAHTTSQFRSFFPAWEGYLRGIIEEHCQENRTTYFNSSSTPNDGRSASFHFANCILDNMHEFSKTEMGITSVILGLLPTMMQQVGPTIAEVSVLAVRRPLLAFLLAMAMPSVSMGGPMKNPAEALRRKVAVGLCHGIAKENWLWKLISAAEYLVAAAAVANVVQLVYQLGFWSISISSIAIDSGILSETYPPFLWLMLLIPTHVFGFWNLQLRYGPSKKPPDQRKWLEREFKSCFQGDPLLLKRNGEIGPLAVAVSHMTRVSSVVVFIFGTVVLSSQIFISLGDVVPVIARFMLGTLTCRLVLSFELHGLRKVTSEVESKEESEEASKRTCQCTNTNCAAGPGRSTELGDKRDKPNALAGHVFV